MPLTVILLAISLQWINNKIDRFFEFSEIVKNIPLPGKMLPAGRHTMMFALQDKVKELILLYPSRFRNALFHSI